VRELYKKSELCLGTADLPTALSSAHRVLDRAVGLSLVKKPFGLVSPVRHVGIGAMSHSILTLVRTIDVVG